ncbi:uncharacterized protein LOC114573440 isoform X2 [Perca flavescens]|uniref:uncharacterized protein LOC114573440 isoform X2 n=1 Tax=Perca flavescens TaxID=8167 RepID=UPI00106E4609|nr:uncharacterized protein LOC114573440 isoform X2 [Perca flavescens]
MDQIRWIIMSSFLMLLVQFTVVAWKYSSSTVRVGDEVTLSCLKVTNDQDQCNSTAWFFIGSGNRVTLFEHGQIHKEAKTKSDRLSVTENCSLVIKKVTYEDAARYICRQFRSGQLHGEGTVVYLSVVTMTEQKNDDTVTLFCSVLTYGGCVHTVKWLYEGDKTDVKTTQLDCSGTVTFTTSHLHQKSEYYELLKCEVTHHQDVQLFTFIPSQSSSEKPGWWRIIVVSLGLASLITSVVVVNIWARAKAV